MARHRTIENFTSCILKVGNEPDFTRRVLRNFVDEFENQVFQFAKDGKLKNVDILSCELRLLKRIS